MVESGGGDQASRSQERAELLGDARAALTWAYANDDGADLRVPLAGACARLFVELNLLNEGRLWASRALAALDDTSRGSTWELELQSTLGHAFMFTERNSEQAEGALRRGLEIAEALGDHFNKFRLLARLNMFYRRTGEYRHLLPIALEAERIARAIGDTAGIAGAKALVGVFLPPCRQPAGRPPSIWRKALLGRCGPARHAARPFCLFAERRRFRSRVSCGCGAFPTRRSNVYAR